MRKQPGVSWEEWFIRLFLPLSPGRLLRHGLGQVALWVAGIAVVPPLLLAAIMAPPCYLCALVTAWYYNRTSGRPAAVWASPDRRAVRVKGRLSYEDKEFIRFMESCGVPNNMCADIERLF